MALFWRDIMKMQKIGSPLEPGPIYLVIYPMNRKYTVGHHRGRGPELERGRRVEKPKTVLTLL